MANGTTLPSGCYLSVASPPSRDADDGLTMFGWFYVPSYASGEFYSTLLLNYATNDVGEGFQFEASSTTQSQGFVMCYPPNYSDIGGTYTNGIWYFLAEVFTRSGGVTTRRTYISTTGGATPTLISTQTWTVADASPEYFDIGEARTYSRSLRGSLQYVGLAPVAMSTSELATQSNSTTPTVSCWVFIAGEEGVYTDSSGNSRTVTATGGTPTAASVGAPVAQPVSSAVAATAGAPVAALTGTVAQPPVSVVTSAVAGGPSAAMTAVIGQPQIAVAVTATAGAPVASVVGDVAAVLPRIILYGHSVIAGYGISDPNLHIAPQLKTLLGSRVEQVIELGYSGETSATLLANFSARVSPYVESGRETILAFTIAFNSAHAGVSAVDIMFDILNMAVLAANAGVKVIFMTETKADADSQAHEETLLGVNGSMKSLWPTYADGLVDTRLRFFDPTDTLLYQADGAHPTGYGDGVLAGMLYFEIDRILSGVSSELTVSVGATAGAPVASANVATALRSVAAAVAGGPRAAILATLGTPLTSSIEATAGAPAAGAIAILGEARMVAVAATAGAPIASVLVELIEQDTDLGFSPCTPTSYVELTLTTKTRVVAL
jgi:hypothetical protein